MATEKSIKPANLVPRSFGGEKNNFSDDLIANGYEVNMPQTYNGDNLNYQLDATGKELDYCEKVVDYINGLGVGKTPIVNANNKLDETQVGLKVYSATETYSLGEWVKSSGKIYESLTQGNLGNDLTNETYWKEVRLGGGSGLELCDIGMALYVDETKGLRRYLNGQIVDINTNTQAFLNRLQQITTLYPSLLCTENEWQTAKTNSAFGQVGKFVFNYSGGEIVSVRLPRVVNIQGVFDLQNLGMTVGAGLPNITGNTGYGTTLGSATGCFYIGNTAYVHLGASAGNAPSGAFDASRSNPIYGNSNTVQPEAIQYPYFIQIATGSETENNIINEIELNNPFSLFDSKYSDHELNNLSWLKSEGQWNAKTVYPDAYDKLLKVQNGTETVEGLSVKLSTETYTDYDFVLNTADETFRLPLKTLHSDDTVDSLSLYFYVGETVQNANLIDAGRIGEQLADKVDTSNTQWATNACMPDYTAGVSFTAFTGSNDYICPKNGYIFASVNNNTSSHITLKINNTSIGFGNITFSGSYDQGTRNVPVNKNDIISFTRDSSSATCYPVFYPLKGEN